MGMQERIWHDKKRYFGLPISFTNYSIEDSRLYCKRGIIIRETNEILLYRILDIKARQSLWQRLFGVGTIVVYSADITNGKFLIENVRDHDAVYRMISNMVEQEREARGIAGSEMYGSGDVHYR